MALDLLLIRHAESIWNADGRWQGHGDPPLSPRGVAQAEALAVSLKDERPDVLLCSDLRRALETATFLGRAWGIEPRAEARYRELDIGSWTGLRREEIARQDPETLARFDRGDPDVRPGGGESRSDIRARAAEAIRDLLQRHSASRIALVTHLGFLRALLPGAEPCNAEVVRIRAGELLRRRARAAESAGPAGPF